MIARALGSTLWTVDGRRLIDFASGVLVANLGHNHPGFERRYAAYREGLPRTGYNFTTPVQVAAAERLIASVGLPGAQRALWAASGSEAIQKAMWAALRRYPDRRIMAATRGGFHGKKGLANDVTGESSPNPDVRWISFPLDGAFRPEDCQRELDALAAAHPEGVALLITEPYLGAHGSYHPPAWYHQMLSKWCVAHDVPFIFDEVQSCHGRTGNMYAFEGHGVQPDLVVLGKGLANGVPAAAVVGRADLIDALDYGEASDTFSGNPDACAAALAVLDVFDEEGALAHCRALAPALRAGLDGLRARFGFVTAVRGEGFVYGIEIKDPETARRCVLETYRGTAGAGVHFLGPLAQRVLRVSPPLVMDAETLEEAFAILHAAWERIQPGAGGG